MGVGTSFTAFLIRGIPLSPELVSAVASLGGIAHTIYALFDSLLDTSGAAPRLFSELPLLSEDTLTRSRQKAVLDLVDLYFRQIRSLCPEDSPRYLLLRRTIQKLYKAELHSAASDKFCWSTWWRKNVLPIVVMGLPAWLSMPDEATITFAGHLRWLSRVGEFLGWLDDFADYEGDCASGQLNRLRFHEHGPIGKLARKVGAKGRRVLELWDSINDDSPARDTFTVIAWMWLAPRQSELPLNGSLTEGGFISGPR
jgi:hypothetical protein